MKRRSSMLEISSLVLGITSIAIALIYFLTAERTMIYLIAIIAFALVTISIIIASSFYRSLNKLMEENIIPIESKIVRFDEQIRDLYPDTKKFPELRDDIFSFLKKNPYQNNVYLIADYRDEKVINSIKSAVRSIKLNPIVTQEFVLSGRRLWDAVRVHLVCSRFIIVLLSSKPAGPSTESIISPNLMLELGFALSLDRNILILVDKGASLPSDIEGQHYIQVDQENKVALSREIRNWLAGVV